MFMICLFGTKFSEDVCARVTFHRTSHFPSHLRHHPDHLPTRGKTSEAAVSLTTSCILPRSPPALKATNNHRNPPTLRLNPCGGNVTITASTRSSHEPSTRHVPEAGCRLPRWISIAPHLSPCAFSRRNTTTKISSLSLHVVCQRTRGNVSCCGMKHILHER